MITLRATTTKTNFINASQLSKIAALALTRTAQDAQTSVMEALPKNFTVRTPWWKKTNKYGIKVKAAEKSDPTPTAEVGTNADWLDLHEQGDLKKRNGVTAKNTHVRSPSFQKVMGSERYIALPRRAAKRTKRDLLRGNQKPLKLKRAFAVETSKLGKVIFRRTGRGKKGKLLLMYKLIPVAQIKETDTVIDPAVRTIAKTLNKNFIIAMDKVIKTK